MIKKTESIVTSHKRYLNYLTHFCRLKALNKKDEFNLLWINECIKKVGNEGNVRFKENVLTQSEIDSMCIYLDLI